MRSESRRQEAGEEFVQRHPLKIGFLGTTGVGKDTCCRCIQKLYPRYLARTVKLAQPLYEAQNFIYRLSGVEKKEEIQDGVLLNFLGKHMRQIDSQVLIRSFAAALREIGSDADLILCPDVRPIDASHLKAMGFILIHVTADPEIALQRRKERRDLSLSQPNHETEQGFSLGSCDYQIVNNGTLEELERQIQLLMQRLS